MGGGGGTRREAMWGGLWGKDTHVNARTRVDVR